MKLISECYKNIRRFFFTFIHFVKIPFHNYFMGEVKILQNFYLIFHSITFNKSDLIQNGYRISSFFFSKHFGFIDLSCIAIECPFNTIINHFLNFIIDENSFSPLFCLKK